VKIGINTFLFASPFTDGDIPKIRQLRELGFDGVEFALENKGDFRPKDARKALKDNGLECAGVCGAFGPGRDLRGTRKEQETAKRYVMDCVDAAVELETDLFAGPLYSRVGRANAETEAARREQWKIVVDNLGAVCAHAAKKGVYVALEPLNRFETDFINIEADAKRMVRDVGSDRLKIHLDTFHMNIEEKSPGAAILDAGDLLYHVHASENDRGAPGTGSVNWGSVRDALRNIGYARYLVIESFTPEVEIIARAASIWRTTEKSSVELARKGMRFLRAFFGE
jgi:D-psicose/D-tagatose/L-ribulose 3-epimerase